MLPLLFALLLCFQWVAGDDARIDRQNKSAVSPHVLSQLLVKPKPKFVLRGPDDGCATGWHVCPNYPDACAPDGNYCCDEYYNCPNDSNCFGLDECCPQDAETCGGQTCCEAGATCCDDALDCCDPGYFCCNDSFGGCCPDGMSCTVGENTCSVGGSGSDDGGSTPSSSSPSPTSSPTISLATPTLSPTAVGTSTSKPTTTSGSSGTAASSAPGTTSSVPVLGDTSGSPHSISVMSVGKTASLAVVAGIIALGRSLF